jgi:hypothetical protein
MTIDFGSDLACSDDLDPGMGEASGILGVKQACYRRLITQRGQLLGDPSYGLDVRDFLSAEVTATALAQIPGTVDAELLKDERVASSSTVATWDARTSRLRLAITIETAAGPFTMTLAVDNVAAVLLEEAA